MGRRDATRLKDALKQGRRDFDGWDLEYCDLTSLDLRETSFRDANLCGADLAFARLDGACFDNASLAQAYLLDATCRGASFRDAMLESAFLRASFEECDFRRANLNYAYLAGANLNRATLPETQLVSTVLTGAALDGAQLNGTFVDTILVDSDLAVADNLDLAFIEGPSQVDFATLRKTASTLRARPKKRQVVERFLADIGLDEDALDYFRTLVSGAMRLEVPSLEEFIAKDPLGEHLVIGNEPQPFDELRKLLETATREEELQQFLQQHPRLLARKLRSGHHGRWVIPKPRFGSEYVPDFLLAEKNSLGTHWTLVELENPTKPLFTKSGEQAEMLRHAIRQIRDWREWLKRNLSYATRARSSEGLGLCDIEPDSRGLIVLGRRAGLDDRWNSYRRRIEHENNIEVHTYDWLLD